MPGHPRGAGLPSAVPTQVLVPCWEWGARALPQVPAEGWLWLWVAFPEPRVTGIHPSTGSWDTAPLQQMGFYLLGNDAFLI